MAKKADLEMMETLMLNEQTMLFYTLVGLLVVVAGLYVRIFGGERVPDFVWAYLIFAGIVSAAYGVSTYLHRRQVILGGRKDLGTTF
jgi:hypothetical protein